MNPLLLNQQGIYSQASSVLVYDTLTDSDTTLLDNHTPDIDVVGGGWVKYAGQFHIMSNAATPTPLGAASTFGVETNKADVIVSTIQGGAANSAIVARLSDALNHWIFYLSNGKLYEVVGGGLFQRADCGTPAAVPNTPVITCDGTSITIQAAVDLSATYSSATGNQSATKHGLRSYNGNVTYDDFTVIEL